MTVRSEWNIERTMFQLNTEINEEAFDIAKQVSRVAKGLVPVRTGRLRDSIIAKKSKFKNGGAIVKAGGKGAKQAWLIEFGSVKMAKKSYLRPAAHAMEDKAKIQFKARIRKATKRR